MSDLPQISEVDRQVRHLQLQVAALRTELKRTRARADHAAELARNLDGLSNAVRCEWAARENGHLQSADRYRLEAHGLALASAIATETYDETVAARTSAEIIQFPGG